MNVNKSNRCTTAGIGVVVSLSILSSFAAISAAGPKGADMKVNASVESPDIIAVRIRHDMCPLCKELDPQFPKIVREFGDASILFVTLDLTNPTTQKQAALFVGALGLDNVWTGDLTKLGSVTMLDGTDRRALSFVQSTDPEAIRSTIKKAVDARNR